MFEVGERGVKTTMLKSEIFGSFCNLFPNWAQNVTSYKKVGSRTISLHFIDGSSLLFLYRNPRNFSFGSKIWRKRPE